MLKQAKRMLALVMVLVFVGMNLMGCVSSDILQTNQTRPSASTAPSQTTDPVHTTAPTETTVPEQTQPGTVPPQTQPPVTEPPATEPPVTEPPATEPEVTEPDPTEPTGCAHQYDIDIVDATCTKAGYTDYTCTLCGDSYREELAAKGHSFGSWKTTKAATCTENGTKTRSCSRCDKKENQTIAASGHKYGAGTVIQEAASCSDLGTIRHTCANCGGSYDTTYRGNHTFGEPYKTMFSGIRVDCTACGYTITDFYTWREDSYSDCDKTAALYTDTIWLKEPVYTGKLSQWSETWLDWHDLIMDVLRAYGSGGYSSGEYGVGLSIHARVSDYGSADAFFAEFDRFLDAFQSVYNWRPVWDGEPEVYDEDIYLYWETTDLMPVYEKGTNAMSSAERNALIEDLVAFHIHRMGLRSGMQTYNSVGKICEYMQYNLLTYDYNYRYGSSFRGLTCGVTVCQGYAEIFQLFAEYCGIKSELVTGTLQGSSHAWNRVTFSDGTVRYVDVTNLGQDYFILVPWSSMEELGFVLK